MSKVSKFGKYILQVEDPNAQKALLILSIAIGLTNPDVVEKAVDFFEVVEAAVKE